MQFERADVIYFSMFDSIFIMLQMCRVHSSSKLNLAIIVETFIKYNSQETGPYMLYENTVKPA